MSVFLSYSFDDHQTVQKVRNYLVHHGIEVFDDKTDITTGDNITASINEAINSSDAVLFFVSKNSDKSRWVHQEMSLAVSNKLKGKNIKLIPILIEKNVELPFFLKDYLYLDISGSSSFEADMNKLIEGLGSEKSTSAEQDLAAKISNIEIERELLKLKSLEHEEHKKFKSRQMFFVSMIATLVSAIVASVGLLGWVAKIDFANFEWILAFLAGAMASMIGSVLYMRKEKPHKDELLRKIDEIHDSLKKMEAHNDK